jgi:hypothetical protein
MVTYLDSYGFLFLGFHMDSHGPLYFLHFDNLGNVMLIISELDVA